MKSIILTCMCFIVGLAMAQAQPETLVLTPVKKGEEPKEVMTAIKNDFPKAIVNDLSFLPAKLYGEHWAVETTGTQEGTPDYYHISLKEGSESYSAVYDNTGKLISSKTFIKKGSLPAEVTKAIATKYPSGKIENDSEKISYKKGTLKEVYHVNISENNKHRHLFIDSSGKIVKTS